MKNQTQKPNGCWQFRNRTRHTDTPTHRHTDTPTHRHTDTPTHRHTDTAKIRIFLILLLGMFYGLNAQITPDSTHTLGGHFDLLKDRHGETYHIHELGVRQPPNLSQQACVDAGYFRIYYEANSGLEDSSSQAQAFRAVLCQVLTDLSGFVHPSNPNVRVNIWLRNHLNLPPNMSTSPISGSAFYHLPKGSPAGGILDGAVWQCLNSGEDAYAHLLGGAKPNGNHTGSFYHAWLSIDAGHDWHTDLESPAPAGTHDLYTAILQEMTDVLGLTVSYPQGMASGFYFTRYDLGLKDSNGQPVLDANPVCQMYAAVPTNNQPDLADYNAWNDLQAGYTQRYIPQGIAEQMSGLGYVLDTAWANTFSYISTAWNLSQVAALNDGINPNGTHRYYGRVGDTLTLDLPTNAEGLESLYPTGALLLPNRYVVGTPGIGVLRYATHDAGRWGNIGYIIIYGGTNCQSDPCEMITNNGLAGWGCGHTPPLSPLPIACWDAISYSPDVYNTPCNVPAFSNPSNFYTNPPVLGAAPYVGLMSFHTWTDNTFRHEAIQNQLAYHLINGVQYRLTMRVYSAQMPSSIDFFHVTMPATIGFGSSNGPVAFTNIANPGSPAGLNIGSVSASSVGVWETISVLFIYNGPTGHNFLQLANVTPVPPTPFWTTRSYCYIDDVHLTTEMIPQVPAITLCEDDLSPTYFVSFLPPISFATQLQYIQSQSITPPAFITPPPPAPNAGFFVVDTGTPGVFPYTYDMVDYIGCPLDANNTITINPLPVFGNSPQVVCTATPPVPVDLNALLNPSPTGGVFSGAGVSYNPATAAYEFTPVPNQTVYTVFYVLNGCSTYVTFSVAASPTLTPTATLCPYVVNEDLLTLLNPSPANGVFTQGQPTPAGYVSAGPPYLFNNQNGPIGGTYPVTYTVTYPPNNLSCTATANIYVPPVLSITSNALSNPIKVCWQPGNLIDLDFWFGPTVSAPPGMATQNYTATYQANGVVNGHFFDPPNGMGYYQLNYVVEDQYGCIYSAPVEIRLFECCDPPTNQYTLIGTLGGSTNLSTLVGNLLPLSPAVGGLYSISGDLVVDMDYTFDNCDIALCPGSEIVVDVPKFGIRNNSDVHGIDAFWKGIRVNNYLNILDSRLSDAEFGINMQPGAGLFAHYNTFDHNLVDIMGNPGSAFGGIYGNTFDCTNCDATNSTNAMLPAYNGQSTWEPYSVAGIRLDKSVVNVGQQPFNTPLALNIIRNKHHGMDILNSVLDVENTTISHAPWAIPTQTLPTMPAGIRSVGSSLDVLGMGTDPADPDAFLDCAIFGVFADKGIYTRVKKCKMGAVNPIRVGIQVQNTQGGDISIDENLIHSVRTGIEADYNEQAQNFRIYQNQINMDPPHPNNPLSVSTAAINVIETNFLGTPCMINQNELNLNRCLNGILLTSTNFTDVRSNTVNIDGNSATTTRGIWLAGGSRQSVFCNHVSYTPATANASFGIETNGAAESRYAGNMLAHTREGHRISDQCGQLSIRSNYFDDHNLGLHLTASAFTGHQPYMGNLWWDNPNPGQWQAQHDGSPQVFSLSTFKVSQNPLGWFPPTGYTTSPNTISPISGWFFSVNTEDDSLIVGDCPQPQFNFAFRVQDSLAAAGDIPADLYPTATNWTTDYLLYEKLRASSSDWQGTYFAGFYAQAAGSDIGGLQAVREQASGLLSPTTLAHLQLEGYGEQLRLLADSLAALQRLAAENPEDGGYAQQAETLAAVAQNLRSLSETLRQSLAAGRDAGLDTLRAANAGILSDSVYALNQRIINDILLATVARGSLDLSPQQQTQAENIANQCPLAGGRAVYQARGLWLALQPEARWDDDSLCNAVGMSYRQQAAPAAENLFGLQPNPADRSLRLTSLPGGTLAGRIELVNALGVTVAVRQVDTPVREIELEVAALPAGVYSCRLRTHDGSILFSSKFIVQH